MDVGKKFSFANPSTHPSAPVLINEFISCHKVYICINTPLKFSLCHTLAAAAAREIKKYGFAGLACFCGGRAKLPAQRNDFVINWRDLRKLTQFREDAVGGSTCSFTAFLLRQIAARAFEKMSNLRPDVVSQIINGNKFSPHFVICRSSLTPPPVCDKANKIILSFRFGG